MESLQLALQVEVSLQSEPPGMVLAIAHVPFVDAGAGQQTRLLLTAEQATKTKRGSGPTSLGPSSSHTSHNMTMSAVGSTMFIEGVRSRPGCWRLSLVTLS